ncbi:hypothetical protein BCR41DRAFT_230201 [Lobosporangium transversale]|uniref:E3 ubiquitin protein ligase n=1 Tax=Lobosporangium transversale TaxID=64571 RepID=A0A1Y2G662_9FUNG|nr:hypothetical protein BCR41DRAFT_230201 [Lobosporangium transversale]ORY97045.1 hypothetical protein BCR41DRAFT_230201 [Lobosporangium transversale]|eukprot:XP_021875591.1 hypothetical protein BCR41DRAFT_230201 [Lobosporangium transversale]
MEDRGIRKRKLTEEAHSTQSAPSANVDSSSLSSEPGPATSLSKKKKLSESNQDMIDGDHENDTSQSPSAIEDNLLSYQKNVIWNQMQECKKQYLSAQEQVQQLLDKQVEHEAHLSTVDIYWNKLLQDIGMLMIRVDINTEVESLALPDTSVASFMLHGSTGYNQNHETNKFTMETIKATMTARSEHTKEIVNELLRMVANWKNERNSFWSELGNADSATRESRLIEWLSQENDKVTGLQRKGMKDIEKMQAKYHSISDQIVRLRNELEMAKARLEETAESLDESKEKLRRTEKSVDRGKSSIVAAVTSGEIFGENYNGTPDTTIPSLGHMNTKNEAHDGSQDELLQYRELAVARLAELEDMKTQRIQLKNELELLKIQLKHIPDGKIQETPHVKSLLAQLQYARNDAEGYRNESNKIKADLEELYHSRRKFMEDLETEEKGRRAGLEDELKKLESEISRLRDSRDRFQQMYEARCTKDDYEMQQNQEIRKIANTRKVHSREFYI